MKAKIMSFKKPEIMLLDGGLGQEINTRSAQDTSHPLWSVKVMHDEPELVKSVHAEFLAAGAKTVSINTYTASRTRFKRHGFLDRFQETHDLAIALMEQAISESNLERSDVSVAGCLMPLAASYVSEAALDYNSSYDEYCQIIDAQINGVDVFLVETMSNITETRAACDALKSFGLPAHIGMTVSDDCTNRLRSGESLEAAIDAIITADAHSIMINCSYPEAVTMAMPMLHASGLIFGGYANGFTSIDSLKPGTTVDSLSARKDLGPEAYTNHAMQWLEQGATILGGCCEIGPDHIRHLHQRLTADNYNIIKIPS